jgi:hypothetical protein
VLRSCGSVIGSALDFSRTADLKNFGRDILVQVATGLAFMHAHNMAHLDGMCASGEAVRGEEKG